MFFDVIVKLCMLIVHVAAAKYRATILCIVLLPLAAGCPEVQSALMIHSIRSYIFDGSKNPDLL
jgi:hypothetical protein